LEESNYAYFYFSVFEEVNKYVTKTLTKVEEADQRVEVHALHEGGSSSAQVRLQPTNRRTSGVNFINYPFFVAAAAK